MPSLERARYFRMKTLSLEKISQITNALEKIEKKLDSYKYNLNKRNTEFKTAVFTSQEELWKDFKELIFLSSENQEEQSRNWKMVLLLKDSFGGGVWIIRAYLRLLRALVDTRDKHGIKLHENHYEILNIVHNKIPPQEHNFSNEELFRTIFHDFCQTDNDPHYHSPLEVPKIDYTVCLISGVFNELFVTAAFEKGVKKLSAFNSFDFFTVDVHGRKDVKYNAKIIEKTLKQYTKENPNKKIWILAYSKGGIDTLHFLKKNKDYANEYIKGISCVSSPIQGTLAASSKITALATELHKFEDSWIYKKLDGERNFLLKNIPKFMSEEYQKGWLKWNSKRFPEKPIYTTLGFYSPWYEAHVGMILTKLIFKNDSPNDGIVDINRAHFPEHFPSINLGNLKGHHLISARSSTFNQTALVKSFLVFFDYYNFS